MTTQVALSLAKSAAVSGAVGWVGGKLFTDKSPTAALTYSVVRNLMLTGTTMALVRGLGPDNLEAGLNHVGEALRSFDFGRPSMGQFAAAGLNLVSVVADQRVFVPMIGVAACFAVSVVAARLIANCLHTKTLPTRLTMKEVVIIEGCQLASDFALAPSLTRA